VENALKCKSSLGHVKGTYVGELSNSAVNGLTSLSKFKLKRLSESTVKVRESNQNGVRRYSPFENDYCSLSNGMFRK